VQETPEKGLNVSQAIERSHMLYTEQAGMRPFVQLAFEVGHKHTLLPGKQSQHNQAYLLPAPRMTVVSVAFSELQLAVFPYKRPLL
jgi:hypothetical protein